MTKQRMLVTVGALKQRKGKICTYQNVHCLKVEDKRLAMHRYKRYNGYVFNLLNS